tara:strand:- start:71 stop:250 length:180 start_codon:yes stop_codon:yes gene_type:complete
MKKINDVIDTQWSIKVEGKFNRNNTIFHTNKYQKLYQRLEKYNNFIKKPKRQNENTNSL